jgi:transposase
MSLFAQEFIPVPEETARVARAAFPKGNVYMKMRDELGMLYKDSDFAPLFSTQGRPAEAPGRLNLVLVVQHAEGLTDRQVAEAVRGRIDLKYALGLELTDPGFDYSVLSEYRDRLIAGGVASELLDDMLEKFRERGWLKARGRQRTDSTHVLAAIRQLNRLECVGETIRCALNDLAIVAPDWLREQITPDWFELYGARFEQYRLPKEKAERQALGERFGADGYQLLLAIYAEDAPVWLREVAAIQILRQVWVQQYYVQEDQVHWRTKKVEGLPPHKLLIISPYDIQARNRTKRSLNWTGYAVHLTETCDPHTPNVITHVETTPATTGDVRMTASIHTALAEKALLPSEHFVDAGYVDADHLVTSHTEHEIDLCGPVQPDASWQGRAGQGFDLACFAIDWQAQTVTCPQGRVSQYWHARQDEAGQDCIAVRFNLADCARCAARSRCTKSRKYPRTLKLKAQAQYEALQAARQRQTTEEFKQRYKIRAGIEGTISQGTRAFDLRRSRYIGLPKTHLQHVLTAVAMNLARVTAWLEEIPRARTRQSRFAALAFS